MFLYSRDGQTQFFRYLYIAQPIDFSQSYDTATLSRQTGKHRLNMPQLFPRRSNVFGGRAVARHLQLVYLAQNFDRHNFLPADLVNMQVTRRSFKVGRNRLNVAPSVSR